MTQILLLLLGTLLSFVITIWTLGGIEVVLTMLFPYTDIYRDGTTDIYLRRFFIYPRDKDFGKNKEKGRIYLHKFYRGDEDPHLHDHPWPFTSFILTHGYHEEIPFRINDTRLPGTEIERSKIVDGTGDPAFTWNWRRLTWYPRFSILKRPATWKHRVILQDGKPVWTIVKTGVKERSWGFWTDDKSALDFCPWKQYDQGVCYCTPEEKNEAKESVPSQ